MFDSARAAMEMAKGMLPDTTIRVLDLGTAAMAQGFVVRHVPGQGGGHAGHPPLPGYGGWMPRVAAWASDRKSVLINRLLYDRSCFQAPHTLPLPISYKDRLWHNPGLCPIIQKRLMDDRLLADVEKLKESLGELPEPMVRPPFIVVSGLPGSGKSYFCRRLKARLPLVILESDALRRALFPSPSYTQKENRHLFEVCHLLIERLLKKGIPLVLDATNLSEQSRERLYHIADRLGAKLILVRVEAPSEIVRQRLDARQEGRDLLDKSEADWKVYQRMKSSVDRIQRQHFAVDTSRDINPVIDKIVREIER